MSERIFGLHAVQAVLSRQAGRIEEIFVQEGRHDKRLNELLALANKAGVRVTETPRAELDKMVEGRHQGVVALAQSLKASSEKDLPQLIQNAGAGALVLILDGVTDPHNLGACLRSADAAGVTAVVVPKDNSAGLTAVAQKVACGAAETIPFIEVTNLARSMKTMQDAGLWFIGLAGEADRTLYEQDLRGPVGLVMGAEGSGLRRLTRENCDFLASLPMAGTVSSLNVSVATGICLFEAVRQRGLAAQ
ncbi:23S rRNA (guanosine(2251)-2'-O)-methyltransferase RlmB [Spongiibacter sp. KMU-158]|uniref:23S rRNA (guanosine-2'-O-)-methyltransferase RlmB n=1 Tax=Spongiibacter pelagi TaxID=2760804 RepID=A0A927C138_9GAMM|nr:23S rRNA (guanosine(2251)-2'-O)-methyltransferase RlmB [Spongiibacter pelagi]MBD2857952.1 23S rRNA (guanosine(2251)-2'-O)-methyltransferase RlmB [Spongiibacter pelagi]